MIVLAPHSIRPWWATLFLKKPVDVRWDTRQVPLCIRGRIAPVVHHRRPHTNPSQERSLEEGGDALAGNVPIVARAFPTQSSDAQSPGFFRSIQESQTRNESTCSTQQCLDGTCCHQSNDADHPDLPSSGQQRQRCGRETQMPRRHQIGQTNHQQGRNKQRDQH